MREEGRDVHVCFGIFFFLKLQFQYRLWGQWCCYVYSIWWTLTMMWLYETEVIHVFDLLSFLQYPSAPQRGALLSSCCTQSQSRLRWASFWHRPSVPPLFTLLNVCACVYLCEIESASVCLIKLCRATLIAAGASESITIPPSQTPLHLHSSCLVWRISQVGEYIFRVSLL